MVRRGTDPPDGERDGHQALLMGTSTVSVSRAEEERQIAPSTTPPPPSQNRGCAAAPAGEGCEQKKPAMRFGASYLHPAVGKEGGTRLSHLTQVLTCLNVFSAS